MFDDIKHHIKISISADNENTRLSGIAFIGNLISSTEIQTRMKNSLTDDTNAELRRRFDVSHRDDVMDPPEPTPSPSEMLVEFTEPTAKVEKTNPAGATVTIPLTPDRLAEVTKLNNTGHGMMSGRLLHQYSPEVDIRTHQSVIVRSSETPGKYHLRNAHVEEYMVLKIKDGDIVPGGIEDGACVVRAEDLLAILADHYCQQYTPVSGALHRALKLVLSKNS